MEISQFFKSGTRCERPGMSLQPLAVGPQEVTSEEEGQTVYGAFPIDTLASAKKPFMGLTLVSNLKQVFDCYPGQ